MKGAVVLLEREGVLVSTHFTASGVVHWFDGDKRLVEIQSEGFTIKDNILLKAIRLLDALHHKAYCSSKISCGDIDEVRKLLEEHLCQDT